MRSFRVGKCPLCLLLFITLGMGVAFIGYPTAQMYINTGNRPLPQKAKKTVAEPSVTLAPSKQIAGNKTQVANTVDQNPVVNKTAIAEQCYNKYLGPTRADDLAKIESYNFEGVEKYTKELFPPEIEKTNAQELKQLPTFVSGFSSNHFSEGLVMVDAFNETIRSKYKDIKLIVFDLGLSNQQVVQLKAKCSCEVRKFQFEKYPEHVRSLRNFAWKAIVIQLVAKEDRFVIWMDASIRFKTNDMDGLFKQIQDNGLVVKYTGRTRHEPITQRTHAKTFQFLNEEPCIYAFHAETAGGIIMVHANPFINKYFLYPFVACALAFGCMEPELHTSARMSACPSKNDPMIYHICHRSDQSVIAILFHRMYHLEPDINRYRLDMEKYIYICGGTRKTC